MTCRLAVLALFLLLVPVCGCITTDCQALRLLCARQCHEPDTKRVCLELAYEDDKQACENAYRHYARACPDFDSIFDDLDDDWEL